MGPERDSEDDDASAGARERALADHARFVDANLKRNFRANFIHGVLGMTGFRLIYAPTIIPAYLMLLTGSAAAVGLGDEGRRPPEFAHKRLGLGRPRVAEDVDLDAVGA